LPAPTEASHRSCRPQVQRREKSSAARGLHVWPPRATLPGTVFPRAPPYTQSSSSRSELHSKNAPVPSHREARFGQGFSLLGHFPCPAGEKRVLAPEKRPLSIEIECISITWIRFAHLAGSGISFAVNAVSSGLAAEFGSQPPDLFFRRHSHRVFCSSLDVISHKCARPYGVGPCE